MTEPENIVLEHLRRFREEQSDMKREVRSLAHRVTNLELAVANRFGYLESQMATMSGRLDHINEKLDRILTRLDLRNGRELS